VNAAERGQHPFDTPIFRQSRREQPNQTMSFIIGLVIGGVAGFVGGFLFCRNNKSATERANAAIDAAKGK